MRTISETKLGHVGRHFRRRLSFREALSLSYTIRRAMKVSLLVGSILVLINQGPDILSGHWPPVWTVALTYLVPFCVSSYSTAALLSEGL